MPIREKMDPKDTGKRSEGIRPGSLEASLRDISSANLTVVEVIGPSQFHEADNGDYTITLNEKQVGGLTRNDGKPARPGDVLSVQEDGSLQTREPGTSGSFERCKKTAQGAVYAPRGAEGRVFIVGAASEAPN